jgi:GGDEF domain-containing protein
LDTFLGRALTDPATGLPNLPYFLMIQNWEERRARRRKTVVHVIRLHVAGGSEEARRAFLWRLCQELRTSDLIASEGSDNFRILLTTPDAENADFIAVRVSHLAGPLNEDHPSDSDPLEIAAAIEPPAEQLSEKGPCDPCDEHELIRPEQDGSFTLPDTHHRRDTEE